MNFQINAMVTCNARGYLVLLWNQRVLILNSTLEKEGELERAGIPLKGDKSSYHLGLSCRISICLCLVGGALESI